MGAPNFVTFTDIEGNSCRVNTQEVIGGLVLEPASRTPDGAAYTRILTVGGPIIVSGAVATVASSLGVAAATGLVRLPNTPMGTVALASYGTDAVSVAGTWYYSEGVTPFERTVTNVACLNGTTVGTDDVIYAIWDSSGAVLGWTTLAGTVSAVADVYQSIALVTPITCPAGRFYCGFQVEGTTATHQTMAAATYPNSTGSVAGVFGDPVPDLTIAGTFTAGVGPFWQVS